MLKFINSIISWRPSAGVELLVHQPAPSSIQLDGDAFDFASHLRARSGLPFVDWQAARSWVGGLAPERRAEAWLLCERAWLLHLRDALGSDYRLSEDPHSLLLSSLAPGIAGSSLEYMSRTLHRIVRLLDGIATFPKWGKVILVAFEDATVYYDYVGHYYPEEGEFSTTSGVYLHAGCGHFATVGANIWTMQHVIAHEMTHSCVSHLPIPNWLNEGLAVNAELRLTLQGSPRVNPRETHRKLQAHWSPETIQDFWSGKAFSSSGEGSALAYELARVMVEQMGKDWRLFQSFATHAHRRDAGAGAASEHLGAELGRYVAALLEAEPAEGWEPNPETWLRPQASSHST